MASAISLVTLLTDFGERDYFVASMKGVILSINPQARIVDLSHEITPHRIEEAAYVLNACYRYFPDGTIHLVVVDPGVGTDRRPLLVSSSRYFFVAPDNGLLSSIYQDEHAVEVRRLENAQYRLVSEGTTFDGRDVFAPAAAWLTKGQAPGSFGRLIRDYTTLPSQEAMIRENRLLGKIIYIDRFGNLITNVTTGHLQEFRQMTKQPRVSIRVGAVEIAGMASSYADGDEGSPRALINSNGQLEIFVKEGRAVDVLQCTCGEPVEIR